MSRQEEVRQKAWFLALDAGREWEANAPRIKGQLEKIRLFGPQGADTPTRVRKFVGRELARTLLPTEPVFRAADIGLERVFGPTIDFEYVAPSPQVQSSSRGVARLVEVGDGGARLSPFATGFMVSPQLLLTNWHVFETPESAEGVYAQFGYELMNGALQEGVLFQVRPELFFHSDRELDYALVAVDFQTSHGQQRGASDYTRLIPTEGKILVGHSVHMIGYPNGQPKTYVFKNNPLVLVDGTRLQYLTDSDEGGSGSPAYNSRWEVVALHHRAVPKMENGRIVLRNNAGYWREGTPTDQVEWIANQGMRISVIVKSLQAFQRANPHELLDELLKNAVDPIGVETMSSSGAAVMPIETPPGLTTAPVQLNFTGPVTINIVQPAPQQPTLVPAAAPPLGEEAVIRFDPGYDDRPGYDPQFLSGFNIPHPTTSAARLGEMIKDGRSELVLKYHHFSLAMNRDRRLQMWSAVNVDYAERSRRWFSGRKAFGSDKWIPDPRIPARYQIMDPEAYEPSRSLQRGHVVRRDDNAWGTNRKNQEYANSDTFHWTNCTPQHGGFNQADHFPGDGTRYEGIWGALENKVAEVATRADNEKLIIFAGPVLDPADDTYTWGVGDVQIPMKFWKIVVAVESGTLRAYGFVLDQTQAFRDLGFERLRFGKFEHQQKPIAWISELCGVQFDQQVLAADVRA